MLAQPTLGHRWVKRAQGDPAIEDSGWKLEAVPDPDPYGGEPMVDMTQREDTRDPCPHCGRTF